MTVYLGTDHGGFELKEQLKQRLLAAKCTVRDLGAHSLDPRDDYPMIALRVARAIAGNRQRRGILLCRSGVGVTIVANKIRGVRAVLATTPWVAKMARRDEDANVLALPAEKLTVVEAWRIVRTWLNARYARLPRYDRRLRQIHEIERGKR